MTGGAADSYTGPDRRSTISRAGYRGLERRASRPALSPDDVTWIKRKRAREEAMGEIAKHGATALRLIVLIAAATVAWEQLKPMIRGWLNG
jgi:hypothetical protein